MLALLFYTQPNNASSCETVTVTAELTAVLLLAVHLLQTQAKLLSVVYDAVFL